MAVQIRLSTWPRDHFSQKCEKALTSGIEPEFIQGAHIKDKNKIKLKVKHKDKEA